MKFRPGRPGKPKTDMGANIFSRRRMLRLTASEVATRAGMDRRTITRISQGDANTRIETLYTLAAVLECHAWELLKPGTFQG